MTDSEDEFHTMFHDQKIDQKMTEKSSKFNRRLKQFSSSYTEN